MRVGLIPTVFVFNKEISEVFLKIVAVEEAGLLVTLFVGSGFAGCEDAGFSGDSGGSMEAGELAIATNSFSTFRDDADFLWGKPLNSFRDEPPCTEAFCPLFCSVAHP